MATVAATVKKRYASGDRWVVIADVTLTGSYLTGGEALAGSALGLEAELTDLNAGNAVGSLGIFEAEYNHATGKIQLFGAVDATPAANEACPELAAAALPGGPLTLRVRAIGKGNTGI